MRFTHLKLENWRNFTRVDVALAQRVFVVGANASGKSNLLDVFRFLKELAQPGGGLTNALDRTRRGLRAVRSLHSRRNHVEIEVSAQIDGSEWRYLLRLGPGTKPGSAVIQAERAWRAGRPVLVRPDIEDQQDGDRLKQTFLEQTTQNKDLRALATFLALWSTPTWSLNSYAIRVGPRIGSGSAKHWAPISFIRLRVQRRTRRGAGSRRWRVRCATCCLSSPSSKTCATIWAVPTCARSSFTGGSLPRGNKRISSPTEPSDSSGSFGTCLVVPLRCCLRNRSCHCTPVLSASFRAFWRRSVLAQAGRSY